MPVIATPASSPICTTFFQIRGAAAHLGISALIQKKALQLIQQNKKVLVIDSLLGLKNISIPNKNASKLDDFFKGLIPLSELIITYKGIDIIAGVSQQNINAIPHLQQQKFKQDLILLASNYDIVLIDQPYNVTQPIFDDLGITYWVISLDKKIALDTLKTAHTDTPNLILNEPATPSQLNELMFFLKVLAPKCHLETHFI